MKHFVVIGLGIFGQSVALELINFGHQVLVLDTDEKKVEAIKDQVTDAVVGDPTDKKVLAEFVGKNVDAVILNLDQSLEASALTTLNLNRLEIERIIVKVPNESFGVIMRAIGATDISNPEWEGGKKLAQRLHKSNLIDLIPLDPDYNVVELPVPESFVDKSLEDLRLRQKYGVVVIAVKEVGTNKFHLIPKPDYRFQPDTAMVLFGKGNDIEKLKV